MENGSDDDVPEAVPIPAGVRAINCKPAPLLEAFEYAQKLSFVQGTATNRPTAAPLSVLVQMLTLFQ